MQEFRNGEKHPQSGQDDSRPSQLLNLLDELLLRLVLGVELVLPMLHRVGVSEDLLVRFALHFRKHNSLSALSSSQVLGIRSDRARRLTLMAFFTA